jgi:hypothetical protein
LFSLFAAVRNPQQSQRIAPDSCTYLFSGVLNRLAASAKAHRRSSDGFSGRASHHPTDAAGRSRTHHALIHRRNRYTGGSELKRARKDFLTLDEDPATIEREFRDAKKRYRRRSKRRRSGKNSPV